MEDISIFNTSAITSREISDDELKGNLEISLNRILKKEFPNNLRKQYVKVKRDEFQFACPFCGDSASDSSKKRAHILLEGKFKGLFKCFNCGKSMDVRTFFKSFNIDFDMSTTDKLIEMSETPRAKDTSIDNGIDMIVDISEVEKYGAKIEDLKNLCGFVEISSLNKNEGYYYLVRRCQFNFSNFLYDPKDRNLIVMNRVGQDRVIGFQKRDLSGKRDAKYLSYNLASIHKDFLKDSIEVPENLNKVSLIFNLFNVNIRKNIIVTEGPMDAFLIDNAVASAGAGKTIPLNLNFYYLYDDDQTGRKHAVEQISSGHYVFLWSRLKNELSLPDRKKWDVNDVIVYLGNKSPMWNNYFSNDSFDILDI